MAADFHQSCKFKWWLGSGYIQKDSKFIMQWLDVMWNLFVCDRTLSGFIISVIIATYCLRVLQICNVLSHFVEASWKLLPRSFSNWELNHLKHQLVIVFHDPFQACIVIIMYSWIGWMIDVAIKRCSDKSVMTSEIHMFESRRRHLNIVGPKGVNFDVVSATSSSNTQESSMWLWAILATLYIRSGRTIRIWTAVEYVKILVPISIHGTVPMTSTKAIPS